jgi:hypothetical protein
MGESTPASVGEALVGAGIDADHYDDADRDMGYEELVQPLKLTGGQIALRIGSSPWWVVRRGSGRLYNPVDDHAVLPYEIQGFVRSYQRGQLEITPVLRAEVPDGD